MKTNVVKLCAVILLAAQTIALAQKTEVRVQKGKVVAEAGNKTVAVEAGRMAVLTPNASPVTSVDNPLAHDALELYKLAEAEKQRSGLNIDSVFIMVGKADKDEAAVAIYFEAPNYGSEATDTFTLQYTSLLGDFRVYDLAGNLCPVQVKDLGNSAASYSIKTSQPVQPGEHFKLIGVTSLEDIPLFPGGAPVVWREGPLVYFRTANNSLNALNYYRFILPATAILVDTNREIVATDTVDGRLAVTMRNYTGPYYDGMCMIAFLYPEEDGTTLTDIPDKYLGLQSQRDKQNTDMFQRQMNEIRAGKKYTDQSTPLAAWLTCLASVIRKDIDLYAKVKYTEQAPESVRGYVEQAAYYVDLLDSPSLPAWPENPGHGYVHPVYLCRKGSKIDEFTQPMVYQNGQWYVHDTKNKAPGEGEIMTPGDIAAAQADGYPCGWEVAGPYIQEGKTYKELFDIPFGPELPDTDVPWRPIGVKPYEQHPAYVDLDQALYNFDQAAAYLRTEIVSEQRKSVRLEINTDDGVKAWLNGKLIHTNNINRGVSVPPDILQITLEPGVNKLMLKVTDSILGWGAVVRVQPTGAEAGQD